MNISKAAAASGVTVKMIRHYEACGLITASRRSNNYRSYDEKSVAELNFIRHGRALSFSLAEIKQLLRLWQADTPAPEARRQALGYAHAIESKGEAIDALLGALKQLAEDTEDHEVEIPSPRQIHLLPLERRH